MTVRPGIGPRALALLLAVFWGYFFFGVIDLLVFLQGPEFQESFHLETGWGLLFVFLVAVPLVAVAAGSTRITVPALQQVLLAAVAVAVGAALSASPKHLLAAAGLAGTVGLLAVTTCGLRTVLTLPDVWHWGPGVLVLAAAGPWVAYALAAADAARAGARPSDETWELNHWPVQAALAIALVLMAALAASLTTGWLIPTWCVGVSSAWFGVGSWIYPDLAAGLGRWWGVAAVAWGVTFVGATHLSASRKRARTRSRR